jgi:hypothetical protein
MGKVSCKACGHTLDITADDLGRAVQCPACKSVFKANVTSAQPNEDGLPANSAQAGYVKGSRFRADSTTRRNRGTNTGRETVSPEAADEAGSQGDRNIGFYGGGRNTAAFLGMFGWLSVVVSLIGMPMAITGAFSGREAAPAFALFFAVFITGVAWLAVRAVMKAIFDGAEDIAAIRELLEDRWH